MTLEETVAYFKDMVEGCGAYELCPCFHDDMEMTKIALYALKKLIARNPSFTFKPGLFLCPECRHTIKERFEDSRKRINYCPFCGQALD